MKYGIDTVNSSIKMQIFQIIKMYLKVTNYFTHFLDLVAFSQVSCFPEGNQSLKFFLVDYSYFSSFFFLLSGSLMSMFEVSVGMLIPGICGSTRDIRIF